MRHRKLHRDASTYRYKPKKRSSSRSKRKKLNAYARFVRSHRGMGLTLKEIARLYRQHKRETKGSHRSTHTRKGTTMASKRTLPKELLDLARALKEASAKGPGAPTASALERKMESLIRQLRSAQKSAANKARKEREDEEIRAQAREWASKGPSGDYSGRSGRRGRKKSLAAKRRRRAHLRALARLRYGHRRPR